MEKLDPNFDERDLLLRLKDGDHAAFEKLYRKYSLSLYSNILRLVHDESVADDLFQDLFLKIWRYRENINPDLPFGGYLFTSSQRIIYNYIRHAQVEKQVERYLSYYHNESYNHVEEQVFFKETDAIVQAAIDQLPPQRQKIYRLCKIEGLSYDEVSKQLNIGRSTVQDHMVKANKFIKETLLNANLVALSCVISALLSDF